MEPPTEAENLYYAPPLILWRFMKCKARWCDLESGHAGKCRRVVNAEFVVNSVVVNAEPVILGVYKPGPTVTTTRQVQWQRKNRGRYNEKMKEFMRGYRKRVGVKA